MRALQHPPVPGLLGVGDDDDDDEDGAEARPHVKTFVDIEVVPASQALAEEDRGDAFTLHNLHNRPSVFSPATLTPSNKHIKRKTRMLEK